MELKDSIKKELDFLKSKGHDRSVIEEKFGFSPNYLDQALVRPNEKIYKSLLLYKEWVLCNTIPRTELKDDRTLLQESIEANKEHALANRENAQANNKHADTISRLVNIIEGKINSGETGKVSATSKPRGKVKRNPVQQTNILDKPKIRLKRSQGQQKGIAKS